MPRDVKLYDADGKLIPMRSHASGYTSASTARRAFGWNPTGSHINSLLGGGGVDMLRRRSRDAIRNNGWAEKASDQWVANVVGKGIVPKPRTATPEFAEEIKEVWDEFALEADADGTSDLYGLQQLVMRSAFEGGDGLLRIRPRRASDGLLVPVQFQAIEAEQLDATKNEDLGNGRVIKAGIEFDAVGRRRGYWLFPTHPGEHLSLQNWTPSKFVPAEQIIHVFHVRRPGQVRGVPKLAAMLSVLKEIAETKDAYVMRKKIQNLFVTFETTPGDASVFDNERDEAAPTEHDDGSPLVTLEPGLHQVLPPGHGIEMSQPFSDARDHADFMRTELQEIATSSGSTYEEISGDYSGVNFTSIRASLISLYRRIEQAQEHMAIFQMCRPMYRVFFEQAVLAGAIQVPESEFANTRRLLRPKWQPSGREYVKPIEDVKAAVAKIEAGLSSRERELLKLGIDVEEVDRENQRDRDRAERMGLPYTGGSANALDETTPDEDEGLPPVNNNNNDSNNGGADGDEAQQAAAG